MALTFLAPAFLWGLLALPLVVLLHFVRTRRRQQVVSALFLWQKAAEQARDRRRFSNTWLLLLQLLFVTLAALALARPTLVDAAPPDRVLVVDASASMAATDPDGARLDKARRVAEGLLEGGRVALVRAGRDATVQVPLTRDAAAVREALAGLAPVDREADLGRALDLARSIAPGAEVHLITDAPFPGGAARYHPVAGGGVNAGISTFDVGGGQAYVAVVSNAPRPQLLPVELLQDGRVVAQAEVLVPARGQGNVTFPLAEGAGFFAARIVPPPGDALALDDLAFAGVRAVRVAVPRGSTALERALDAVPGTRLVAAGAPAELRVAFGADPDELPPGDYLLFAERSDTPVFKTVRDWDQADPLMRFVDLREVVVGVPPDWAPEEDEGWQVLARADDLVPVLRRRAEGGVNIVQAAFHPSQSDLVFRPAFPTLIANVVAAFRGEGLVPLGSALPPGATFAGTLPTLEGTAPAEGEPVERANWPGLYEAGGEVFAASLLSGTESRLPGPATGSASGTERAGAPTGEVAEGGERESDVAPWLVLVALVALLTEWLLWAPRRARQRAGSAGSAG